MSPAGVVLFLIGVFALRMLGAFALAPLLGTRERWIRLLTLLPLTIVTAVVAVQTFTTRQDVVVDARIAGVAVAALASWKGAPLGGVVMLAALTTALVRQTGWG